MIVWSSSPWSARPVIPASVAGYTAVSRAVAEVIHEASGVSVEVVRAVLEVLHPVGYEVPSTVVELPRITAEVLGLAVEYAGRFAVNSRTTTEVIGSFAEAYRGFNVPNLFVDAFSIAYSVDLDLSQPGYFGLIDVDSFGYSLSWASASPSTLIETWRVGLNVITSTFPAPEGRLIRSFVLPIGVGEVTLTDLGMSRPPDRPGLGVVQELMAWNRGLNAGERSYTETYLRCKWIPDSCASTPLTPSQQQTIYDGLIASSNTTVNPLYGELLDDLRNSTPFLEFLGCQGAEMPPSPPDAERPFRIDNPGYACPVVDCSPCKIYVPFNAPTGAVFMGDPQASAQQLVGVTLPGFGVVITANAERTIGSPDPCAYSIRVTRANGDEGIEGFIVADRSPQPEFLYLTMAEFLALTDYCIMFDLAAQDIIDSEGYIGDIPEGMEPSEP